MSSSVGESKSQRRGSFEAGVVILGPGPYRVDICREMALVATHFPPPGPVVPMPAPQPLLPLFFVFVLILLTSETNLLPEPGSHPGMCPNQLSPHLWVDAQSTCERECTRDQVSTDISWDPGPPPPSSLSVEGVDPTPRKESASSKVPPHLLTWICGHDLYMGLEGYPHLFAL